MTREVLRTAAATLSSFRVEPNMQGCFCRRARCAVCRRSFSWVDFSARGGIWTPSSAGRGCTPKGADRDGNAWIALRLAALPARPQPADRLRIPATPCPRVGARGCGETQHGTGVRRSGQAPPGRHGPSRGQRLVRLRVSPADARSAWCLELPARWWPDRRQPGCPPARWRR